MVDVAEFIERTLQHASSEYYDPVKAHEYYLKTRELKGRKKAAWKPQTTNQKVGWDYVKSRLNEDQKKESDTLQKTTEEGMKKLQETAKKRAEEISKQLKSAIETLVASAQSSADKIASDVKAEQERIANEAQAKIDALPPIPEGISKSRRQALMKTRRFEIAQIREEAGAKQDGVMSKASEDMKKLKETTRDGAKSTRETASKDVAKVADDFKKSIETARANYKKAREDLKAKYEAKAAKELEAIRTTVR